MPFIDTLGTFKLGNRSVKRLGYGAMQLAGPGVYGRRRTATRRSPFSARPSRRASTTSTPATSTARTSSTR